MGVLQASLNGLQVCLFFCSEQQICQGCCVLEGHQPCLVEQHQALQRGPKGFRRARNYGFLHLNSKRLIALLGLLVFKPCGKTPTESTQANQTERPKLLCRCCGAAMVIVRRRILPFITEPARAQLAKKMCLQGTRRLLFTA